MRRAIVAGAIALLATAGFAPVPAQTASAPSRALIPDLFDPDHHVVQPDLGAVKSIRFLTTDDFPPFHFAMPDGTLAGFDIDLARAICRDLKIACTIQARRFDTLIGEIKDGKDDALIAAVANTPATRADLTFTDPYYTTPARFVGKLGVPPAAKNPSNETSESITPESITLKTLAGHTVGVEAGTAHEAYLKSFFPDVTLKSYGTQADLRAALRQGEVELIFADAIGLAIWLNGTDSRGCCAFRGGPFTESRFFGNGVSIAIGKNNVALRQVLDFELAKFAHDGTYADLYLKYFPIGFY